MLGAAACWQYFVFDYLRRGINISRSINVKLEGTVGV